MKLPLPRGIKKFIRKKIISCLHVLKYKQYLQFSYAQNGEDMILRSFLPNVKKGLYIDVGAHHPQRFSNTYFFYRKGWQGINIDAMPGSMEAFKKERPRDINIEAAISNQEEELTFYIFNDPALNTFSEKDANYFDRNGDFRLIEKKKITTCMLSSVLDKYLPEHRKIDFLSIDAEGWDLHVLKSNNWDKYIPEIVLVEERGHNHVDDVLEGDVYKFMRSIHYHLVAKTYNTLFFKKNIV